MVIYTRILINVSIYISFILNYSFVNKMKLCILQWKTPKQHSLLDDNIANDDIAERVLPSHMQFSWDEQTIVKQVIPNKVKNKNITKDFGGKVKITETYNLSKTIKANDRSETAQIYKKTKHINLLC